MSEHQLPEKTAVLVAGVTSSLTWSAVEFGQAFTESIIKQTVAMRLSCRTTAANNVNIGVRYETATKTYQLAERETIGIIPANGSIEITSAGVAALGQLNEWIKSITVDLTSLSGGSTTVSLILDDDPPPLSNLPGEPIGLDARSNLDYQIISVVQPVAIFTGNSPQTGTLYTVPAGQRFFLDIVTLFVSVTPSFPNQITVQMVINYPAGASIPLQVESLDTTNVTLTIPISNIPPIPFGGSITYNITSIDPTARVTSLAMFGRQVF